MANVVRFSASLSFLRTVMCVDLNSSSGFTLHTGGSYQHFTENQTKDAQDPGANKISPRLFRLQSRRVQLTQLLFWKSGSLADPTSAPFAIMRSCSGRLKA